MKHFKKSFHEENTVLWMLFMFQKLPNCSRGFWTFKSPFKSDWSKREKSHARIQLIMF